MDTTIETQAVAKKDLLAGLRTSGDEVVATLRAATPDMFDRICYAGGWTGREVLAHVAAIEWTYPRLIALARQAADTTDGAGGGGAASARGGMDAYNARELAKRAEATIVELLDEFARNRAATVAAVEATDDALLAIPIRSAGGVTGPLGGVLYWAAIEHVLGHVRDIIGGAPPR